jgi:hypothetical protein
MSSGKIVKFHQSLTQILEVAKGMKEIVGCSRSQPQSAVHLQSDHMVDPHSYCHLQTQVLIQQKIQVRIVVNFPLKSVVSHYWSVQMHIDGFSSKPGFVRKPNGNMSRSGQDRPPCAWFTPTKPAYAKSLSWNNDPEVRSFRFQGTKSEFSTVKSAQTQDYSVRSRTNACRQTKLSI